MRITISFSSQLDIILPVNYNHFIQAMIYKYLEKDFASFLHKQGYKINGRHFKLFCFSLLKSNTKTSFNKSNKTLNFGKNVQFTLSTAVEKIAISMIENQMKSHNITLGQNKLKLNGIKIHNKQNFNHKITIKMLSPVTQYSTNNKKIHFYNPRDPVFEKLIHDNLLKKANANPQLNIPTVNNIEPTIFTFKPLNNPQKIITKYKNLIIEGYLGLYSITANNKLIDIAYDSGIGSKNSMGFGCWELV